MILYASMTGTSVGRLFLAGVVPGVLLRLAFLLPRSLIALIDPVMILGGIATGIVTPTESGALAVAYVALATTVPRMLGF